MAATKLGELQTVLYKQRPSTYRKNLDFPMGRYLDLPVRNLI